MNSEGYLMSCNGMTYSSNGNCGCGNNGCLWTLVIIAVIVLWLSGGFCGGFGGLCGCSDC